MNIVIKTKVHGHYLEVMDQFDRPLFEQLVPPFVQVQLEEFTGSKTGDQVKIRFLFPMKASWYSDIVDHGSNSQMAHFVDEGTLLPPGLRYWRHKHIVERLSETESLIVDQIEYRGIGILGTILMYLPLWFTFLLRKPIYRSFFNSK